MTQGSSGQGRRDDWSTDGYARARYYGAETDGFHDSATADGSDAATSDPFGARPADPVGARPGDGYGPAAGDGYGAGTARTYDAETYAAGTARTYDAGAYAAGTAGRYDAGTGGAHGAAATADAGDSGPAWTGRDAPTAAMPQAGRRQAADSSGFLGALFDFGFTSLVTPKVIKVLYMLITISTVVSALVFTVFMFSVSAVLGILTLVFGAPLFVLIVLALYRILLELFMVAFRISDDIKALRERGDLR